MPQDFPSQSLAKNSPSHSAYNPEFTLQRTGVDSMWIQRYVPARLLMTAELKILPTTVVPLVKILICFVGEIRKYKVYVDYIYS